jgi:hypothetical protein
MSPPLSVVARESGVIEPAVVSAEVLLGAHETVVVFLVG